MNSREFLIGQKAIDKLNNIMDQDKFIQASQSLSDEASTVYGVNGSLWVEKASRAVPVTSVLKEIDDKRRDMGLYESQSAGTVSIDVEATDGISEPIQQEGENIGYTLEDYKEELDSNKRQNEGAGAEDLDLSTFDDYFPEFSYLEETDKEAVLEAIKEGELNVNCKI